MESVETKGSLDAQLVPMVVENPGDRFYLDGHEPVVMELPEGFDIEEARRQYEASGGRISYPVGSTLEHETVGFVEWLVHMGYRTCEQPLH